MATIKAQKLPSNQPKISVEDTLASFCYFYPQYTFNKAKQMPFKRVYQMLKVARKEQAMYFARLTRIAAAPHSKNGSDVKELLKEFNDIINA